MMVSQFSSDDYDIDDHLTGEDTISKPEIEYYFDGTLHKRWQEELSKTHRKVLIFSPYISGDIPMNILETINNQEASEIYTLFEEEIFLNRSSDIGKLITLNSIGFKNIYHLPNLHAKIILIPDIFASIGSQNLTQKGTQNKEASIVITEPYEVRKIEQLVTDWFSERRLISREEMLKIEVKQKNQPKPPRKPPKPPPKPPSPKPPETPPKSPLRLSLEYVESRVRERGSCYSLVPVNQKHKLTHLELDNSTPLKSQKNLLRYLCYNRRKGTFGWIRLGKTRITFIETSLHRTEDRFIFKDYNNRWKFTLNFEFNQAIKNNLKIVIDIYKINSQINSLFSRIGGLTISCTFSEKGIKEWYYCEHQETKLQEQVKEYIDNYQHYYSETFANIVMDAITTPFRYDKALIGVEADSFFGEVRTKYKLRLGNINQQYIVVAE